MVIPWVCPHLLKTPSWKMHARAVWRKKGLEIKWNWNWKHWLELFRIEIRQIMHLDQKEFLCCSPVFSNLLDPLLLLVLHLVPPHPVLVKLGKAGYHDGDGQGQDEDPWESAESTHNFSCIADIWVKSCCLPTKQCLRADIIPHGGYRHQTPPGKPT